MEVRVFSVFGRSNEGLETGINKRIKELDINVEKLSLLSSEEQTGYMMSGSKVTFIAMGRKKNEKL